MIEMLSLLLGRSATGKTTWFVQQNPDHRIMDAYDMKQLRQYIVSTYSQLIEQKPTLINVWFDLDCKLIRDLTGYDATLEIHFVEDMDEIKVVTEGRKKRYAGVKNQQLIPRIFRFVLDIGTIEKWFADHNIPVPPHPERYKTYNHLKSMTPAIDPVNDLDMLSLVGNRYGMIKRNAFLDDAVRTIVTRME